MKHLIISCHPYSGSFQAGVVKTICNALAKNNPADVIDLVAEDFDPVMRGEDLRLWGQGQSADSKVPGYQRRVENADVLVFPFPVWWGAMPALLKGFCDKVLLPGWAYHYGSNAELIGNLTGKKAVVVTTMETPLDVFESHYKNPVEGQFIKDTLQTCGIELIKWFQFDRVVSGGRALAEDRMREIASYFSTLS